MNVLIIDAIIGNYLDGTNKSFLVAITENDKANFIGRSKKDAESMLSFIGIDLSDDEFLIEIKIPSIYVGATVEKDVQVIATTFNLISNNLK
jgi:hypothetical protein